ncbi:hypothetical protein M513_09711 [Trichuris suis]|uniref:JmjC domain-containing protein 5 n=1 Tax=Trichuris suis TaxID=68888 RepID=A0A085LWU8_9BILA|nr:hypothetical protein M513_09711 [Trichuris suis]
MELAISFFQALAHSAIGFFLSFIEFVTARPKSVTDRVIVITGAAQGIGKEVAAKFAALKAKVVLLDVDSEMNARTAEEIRQSGGCAYEFTVDVTKPEEMRQIANTIKDHKDLGCADIVICSAGILIPKLLEDNTDADIRRTFDVNVLGYFWVALRPSPSTFDRRFETSSTFATGEHVAERYPANESKLAVKTLRFFVDSVFAYRLLTNLPRLIVSVFGREMGLQEWLLGGQNSQQQWVDELDSAVVPCWVIFVLHKAFHALFNKDYLTTQKLCKFLLDVAWEKFNIGHWSEVNICWRRLHTLATYLQTMHLWAVGSLKEAMQSCDKGLILGAPLRQFTLTTIATQIHSELSAVEPCPLPSKCSSSVRDLDKTAIMANFCVGITLRAEVKRIHCPSLTEFEREWLHSVEQKPVVIEGALDCWPAFQKWSLEYFLKLAGHRTVPVEIGTRYTDENWTQQLMPLHQFVATYFGENESGDVGYLAQYDLFEQIPELRNDITVPEYCCLVCDADNVDVNAWFGPKGTVSPLHTDPTDNLFAQVMGAKYICLCPPDDSDMVYPIESGLMRNTSQVDMAEPDFDAFPNLQKARVYETVVGPGDLLFIPRGWWHYLKSMTTSFSVSFWFRPSKEEVGAI